jgi:transposase
MRSSYPSDLLDNERQKIEKHFEVDYMRGGRPVKHKKREILNAIFYVLRTGCQWRYLPQEFAPWKTVDTYFKKWKDTNLFEEINHHLRKTLRILLGRNEEPTAAIVDSQSVKTVEKGGSKARMGQKKSMVVKGIS